MLKVLLDFVSDDRRYTQNSVSNVSIPLAISKKILIGILKLTNNISHSGLVQPVWEKVQYENSFAHWDPARA